MKQVSKWIGMSLCVILLAGSLAGCAKEEVTEQVLTEEVIVNIAEPQIGDMVLQNDFIGTVAPKNSTYVLSLVSAKVLAVNVKEGEMVEEGTVLASLDDETPQIQLQQAQLTYENALKNYEAAYGNAADTLNQISSDAQIDSAQDAVQKAQKQLLDLYEDLDEANANLHTAEGEWNQLKSKYDYTDVNDIDDLTKYSLVASQDAAVQSKIKGYKDAIKSYEDAIEDCQDMIDTYYDSFERTITTTNINNTDIKDVSKEALQASLESARLNVVSGQNALEYYTLTAPVSGKVETVSIEENDYTQSGSAAFVITDKDRMTVTFSVSETVRNYLSEGQKILVDRNGTAYDGSITKIPESVNPQTGLFAIEADVNADGSTLLSGTSVKITADTYRSNQAVMIPYDAVYYQDNQAYVYIEEDGYAVKREVVTGIFNDDTIVIEEGISAGEHVVISWSPRLRNGVKLTAAENMVEE